MESAHKMPELLEALIEKAERQVGEVEMATAAVRAVGEIVDRVNRGAQKPPTPQVTGLTRVAMSSARTAAGR